MTFGRAKACSPIQVFLDGNLVAVSCSDSCGHWQVPIRPEPSDGPHRLCVTDCQCSETCIYFTVGAREQPLPAPVIAYPSASIPESSPLIRGSAEPGAIVRICVDNAVCKEITAGADGDFSWQYPGELTEGYHIVTAAAISPQGVQSSTAYQVFRTEGFSEFRVTLTAAHEGSRFRTVALELTVASTLYPVTLYYLLLPPGSPAPDEDQILSYTGPGLLDGTAARGSVLLSAGGRRTVELTGRENALEGALGVADNLRYDVYVIARAGDEQSAVLSAQGALAMPFAGGRGISDDPYLIAGLSRDEILRDYPDLSAARSPLGVDDTARMLRNIDNAQAIYESSGGMHGIRNSMALDYRLTTPLDLSGYASAWGGTGWRPLGYRGNYQTPQYFSGLFSGDNAMTPIRGLTVIREGLRDTEGLFAAGQDGEFEGLTLENTVIRLTVLAGPEQVEQTDIGLLVTTMYGGSLKDITITGAEVTVYGSKEFPVFISFGGIACNLWSLRSGQRLLVENVHLNTPLEGSHNSSMGGMFAIVGLNTEDSGFGGTVLDTILVQDSTFSVQGFLGGAIGSLQNPDSIHNAICRRCNFLIRGNAGGLVCDADLSRPGIRLANLHSQGNTMELDTEGASYSRTAGGMFANIWVNADDILLTSSRVEDCSLTGSVIVGGFIGRMNPEADCLIEDCHTAQTRISSTISGIGGFCGHIVSRGAEFPQRRAIFRSCTVQMTDSIAGGKISGGFAGQCSVEREFFSEPYQIIFEGCESRADLSCTGGQIGGFVGLCNIGSFMGCRCAGRVTGTARTGGFAGELSQETPDFEVSVTRCAANADVFQEDSMTDGGFGGFAGFSNGITISQCVATGTVTSNSRGSSAFLGEMDGTVITDSYATGKLSGTLEAAGGVFGLSSGGRIERCYSQGSIQGGSGTGGIGGLCTEGGTSIQNNMVLSPLISGSTPTARILGGGADRAVLKDNYAVTVQVLQDGLQKQIDNDPDGPDGETITPDQIVPVMRRAGWPEEIWDYSTVTGDSGPKLYHTPERDA